jgi:hypothetical protein
MILVVEVMREGSKRRHSLHCKKDAVEVTDSSYQIQMSFGGGYERGEVREESKFINKQANKQVNKQSHGVII